MLFYSIQMIFLNKNKGFETFTKLTKPTKVYWKASLIVLFKLHHVGYLQKIVVGPNV